MKCGRCQARASWCPAVEQQPSSAIAEAQPVQPHSGYPTYVVPQHPVYATYAYSSPASVSPPQPMYINPAYPSTPVHLFSNSHPLRPPI